MLAARNFLEAISSYDKWHNNGINISHRQSHFQICSKIYRHQKTTMNYQYQYMWVCVLILCDIYLTLTIASLFFYEQSYLTKKGVLHK